MAFHFDLNRPLRLEIQKLPTSSELSCTVEVDGIVVGSGSLRKDDEGPLLFDLHPTQHDSICRIQTLLAGLPKSPYRILYFFSQASVILSQGGNWGDIGETGTAELKAEFAGQGVSLPATEPIPEAWRFRVEPFTSGASAPRRKADRDLPQKRQRQVFTVYYATNRMPSNPDDPTKGYSANRDQTVHYGTCKVFIPEAHKIGSLGSSWLKRMLMRKDDRLKLLAIDDVSEAVYWSKLAARLQSVAPDDKDVVVFVHGYNVTFEESALRAAQLGADLAIKGVMAFFSWPSKGDVSKYLADEATIEASEDLMADYLTNLATKTGARRVHVIAHSMGNRGVLRAVNRITAKASGQSPVRFGQVILAAPDVDVDTFRHLAAAYKEIAGRTTLYVSRRDLAMEASGWLHEFSRAGLMPPVLTLPWIDTINVTNSDLTRLGHGYVSSARDVLNDMHSLIVNDEPPERRFGLQEAQSDDGGTYWEIGA